MGKSARMDRGSEAASSATTCVYKKVGGLQIRAATISPSEENESATILIMDSSLQSFSKSKCQTSTGSGFLNIRTGCSSVTFLITNEESLAFGLLVGQKKRPTDVALGNCDEISFFTLLKIIGRSIDA